MRRDCQQRGVRTALDAGLDVALVRTVLQLQITRGKDSAPGVRKTRIVLELRQTDDPTVYFDARMNGLVPYASPVQVYLECCAGDKREREAAAQVKDFILKELKQ